MSKLFSMGNLARYYILDTLVIFFRRYVVSKDVLLIRLDAIGDFVIWLDSAKEFRRLYPDKKITLCANSAWIDLATGLPYWDEVWPVDVKRLTNKSIYRFKVLREIRKAGFEIVIQPTFSRVFLHGDAMIRVSGATQRIGSEGDPVSINPRLKLISDRWYTTLVPAMRSSLMELERNAEFIRNLSGLDFQANQPVLQKFTQLPERLKISTPYFIVFPGASWHGRQWSSSHFVEVVMQVHQRYGWLAVLCGGLSETRLCQIIVDQSAVPAINLGGATSLRELVELLRGACILISNETSAVHLAAAVSTPAVCILGGGHFGRFMPYPDSMSDTQPAVAMHKMACYNCNWICTQVHDPAGAVPCVSGVTVADVLTLVDAEISKIDNYDIKVLKDDANSPMDAI